MLSELEIRLAHVATSEISPVNVTQQQVDPDKMKIYRNPNQKKKSMTNTTPAMQFGLLLLFILISCPVDSILDY